jgi:hypothetical protein
MAINLVANRIIQIGPSMEKRIWLISRWSSKTYVYLCGEEQAGYDNGQDTISFDFDCYSFFGFQIS